MKIAVSIGDLNGISLEIALKSHQEIKKFCSPIYTINSIMLNKAAALLNIAVPDDFTIEECGNVFEINPSNVCAHSGQFSYDSFIKAIELTKDKKTEAIVTLPINKEAWKRAGISYRGHTEALKDIFKQDAIMMIGCDKLFVSLFTHHIPLREVAKNVTKDKLTKFLLSFYRQIKEEKIAVLGLNPHAGDNGAISDEEKKIKEAISEANKELENEIFIGPLVPDTAFTPKNRQHLRYFVCMYHDQGLIPVKTLYFDESINVSLNLPIVRTSVDHGTAYDIAYKNKNPSNKSYINAVKEAIKLAQKRKVYTI
jgi:4-hydroxythreonine-4-phosphate dehydrogenase